MGEKYGIVSAQVKLRSCQNIWHKEAHWFKIQHHKMKLHGGHVTSMVTLCYPYGPSITCVCHPRGQPVYSCIPTHRGGGGNLGKWNKNTIHREDFNTEIILAVALFMAVLAFFIRYVWSLFIIKVLVNIAETFNIFFSFLLYQLEKNLFAQGYKVIFLY